MPSGGRQRLGSSNPVRTRGGIAAIVMMFAVFAGASTAGQLPLLPPPVDKVADFTHYRLTAALFTHGAGQRWLWQSQAIVLVVSLFSSGINR